MMAVDWDSRFMELARYIGRWSKDESRKVGCVIVGTGNEVRAIGYNGFPRGVNDEIEDRHERPLKYKWTEHAERNAIFGAARAGIALLGCRMYLPWFPCMDCARAIVQCGVVQLICVKPDFSDPQWGDDFTVVPRLLEEGGVDLRFVTEENNSTSEHAS